MKVLEWIFLAVIIMIAVFILVYCSLGPDGNSVVSQILHSL